MEKPKNIYIAQTSVGVFSVVNEHYPGATEYVRKDATEQRDREVMKSYLLDALHGLEPSGERHRQLIDFVRNL